MGSLTLQMLPCVCVCVCWCVSKCTGPERSAHQLRHFLYFVGLRGWGQWWTDCFRCSCLFAFSTFPCVHMWISGVYFMYNLCLSTCAVACICANTCSLLRFTHIRWSVCTFITVGAGCHYRCRRCYLVLWNHTNQFLYCRTADRCLVMSNTERLISRFNWFSLQQGHSQAYVCVCAIVFVSVPHNWRGHIPISNASCAPVWIWQHATGPFPLGVLNVYTETPTLCTPLW